MMADRWTTDHRPPTTDYRPLTSDLQPLPRLRLGKLTATFSVTAMSQAAEWHCYNGAYPGYRSSSFGWLVVGRCQSCRPDDREDGDETGPTSSRSSAWKKDARARNAE